MAQRFYNFTKVAKFCQIWSHFYWVMYVTLIKILSSVNEREKKLTLPLPYTRHRLNKLQLTTLSNSVLLVTNVLCEYVAKGFWMYFQVPFCKHLYTISLISGAFIFPNFPLLCWELFPPCLLTRLDKSISLRTSFESQSLLQK